MRFRRHGDPQLVPQDGEPGHVGIVFKGLAKASLVVPELRLGKRQFPLEGVAFGLVAAGQPFQGIEDGPRAVMLSR